MDGSEVVNNFRQLWESKPGLIVLLFLGFTGFLVLVIDTWRHRRHRKRPR